MTKAQIDNILDRLEFWNRLDDARDKAIKNLCMVFAKDSNAPILTHTFARSFIDAINLMHPGMEDDLAYYIYEAPGMKQSATITLKDGRKFNAKIRSEFVEFLFISYFQK